jgi:maltooligosyltrehalose trehalohydrolase
MLPPQLRCGAAFASAPLPEGAMIPLLGAEVERGAVHFGAYAPHARRCAVRRFEDADDPDDPMAAVGHGYFEARVRCGAGTLYKFVVDGRELPDPYARYLPLGVHGPAAVVHPGYTFRYPEVALPFSDQVLYELDVGAFTPEGTYDAACRRLGYLAALGVRTIELMPLSAFSGRGARGYDGVAHYAPFAPYGTPDALRRFVDEAHAARLSVVLDVVYSHFGSEGSSLGAFADEYFDGDAAACRSSTRLRPNFASPAMRRYVVDNAAYWLREFRFDGLRLDAVPATEGAPEPQVLRELTASASALGKHLLFAEDERQAGEREGGRRGRGAYLPGPRDLADAINHGLMGPRAFGDRLSASASADAYRAVSMLLLFLPMTPWIFMGQEWAASTPFDPRADDTLSRSKLRWEEPSRGPHAEVLALYRELLYLRHSDPVLRVSSREGLSAAVRGEATLVVRRQLGQDVRVLCVHFGDRPVSLRELGLEDADLLPVLSSAGDGGDAELSDGLRPHEAVILAGRAQRAASGEVCDSAP